MEARLKGVPVRANPLLENIRSGKPSLGLYINSPDMVELCGFLGFDWFLIDQMFTANDWSKTEGSRSLTGGRQPAFYQPALWAYVDRAVELGRKHDVVIGANTSYAYSLEELANRVRRLREHDVKMIMVQGAPFLFQVAMTEFLRDLRPVFE